MTTFAIKTADLKSAVKCIRPAYHRRNTIPVLSHVLVQAKADAVSFTTTNLDLEIEHISAATSDGECAFTMPFPALAGLSTLDCDAMVFDVIDKPQRLSVTADGFIMSMNLLCPAADFPLLMTSARAEAMDVTPSMDMTRADLHRFLRMALPSVSTEETRYYLNGVYFCKSPENTMRAVATDGHRLARIDSAIAWAGPEVIMPRRTCAALMAQVSGKADGVVSMAVAPMFAVVKGSNWTYRAKMIDGKYPDYTRVIPKYADTITATLSAAQIKRLGVAAQKHMRQCAVLSPGQMSISDNDGANITVGASVSGPDGFKIGFDRRYLADQAKVTPVFKMSGAGPNDPMRIIGEDPLALFVIMPMRV